MDKMMNEKRFTIGMLKNYVNDNKTNYCYVLELSSDAKHLCNLLNQLSNENGELKQFQNKVAEVIESKMGDNVCNDYKMEVLKEIWNELELDEVWFE